MKETQFIAPIILLKSPLMFEILEKIRDRHDIDALDPTTLERPTLSLPFPILLILRPIQDVGLNVRVKLESKRHIVFQFRLTIGI